MSELRDLYQQVILDHNRAPRNFKEIEGANRSASGHNPLCGDELKVTLHVSEDGLIDEVGFHGSGCAISKASASLMTEAVKGKTESEVEILFEKFHDLVTGVNETPDRKDLGKLVAFQGVREFPSRVKCASLSWHTLRAALKDDAEGASTE